MKFLLFGRNSDLRQRVALHIPHWFTHGYLGDARDFEVVLSDADVTSFAEAVTAVLDARPDWIMNFAGVSDLTEPDPRKVIEVNLTGSLHVLEAALTIQVGQRRPPGVILTASTAGIVPSPAHPAYNAAKAGVISLANTYGLVGWPVWAVSPGRIDTKMRRREHPGEDPATALSLTEAAAPYRDIVRGLYAPGANVVIRRVGAQPGRVDCFEAPRPYLPSML